MTLKKWLVLNLIRHNPYFNRWFSAIFKSIKMNKYVDRHNPYFNRWFSAIRKNKSDSIAVYDVTILILIDGFLQYWLGKLLFRGK